MPKGLCMFAMFAASAIAAESFVTPGQAANAFVRAAEANDVPALLQLFGSDNRDLIESGDPVHDRNQRAAFARNAHVSMKLQSDPDDPGRVLILTGDDQDPFAVPLVRRDGAWQFDAKAGRTELLARRIGANELDAIAFARDFVAAENSYATGDLDANGQAEYAQKFASSSGTRDGLYWPAQAGGPVSPVSIGAMRAAAEGYAKPGDRPSPYHGYVFKILKAQGEDASGGARDYVVQGLMIGGFALVAWPAEYGASGIKTFVVNQDGVIYEKDLGRKTTATAEAMSKFNPDKSWHAVQ